VLIDAGTATFVIEPALKLGYQYMQTNGVRDGLPQERNIV
jgi:hypothetical protein